MSELEKLLEKIELNNFMEFLLYGTDTKGEIFKNYGEEIENSYSEVFKKLEELYSEADREDNRLHDVIVDFAMLHDDIYFEAGVLVGFQLFKNLEHGYKKHSLGDIQDILEKKKDKKSIL